MARKVIRQCPSCDGELEVTRLSCTECETEILGRFELTRFAMLPLETLQYLEVFIKNRGNIKKMERELNDSYWTIRAKLDEVIKEMGFEVEEAEDEARRDARPALPGLQDGAGVPQGSQRHHGGDGFLPGTGQHVQRIHGQLPGGGAQGRQETER